MEHLEAREVCRFVRSGSADQLIQYDLDQERDRAMLFQEWQKKKSLFVEESFIRDTTLVRDRSGAPYAAQLLLSLSHTGKIYNGAVGYEKEIDGFQSVFPPGSQWLYLELFCHPYRADQLLSGPVSDFLHRYREHYTGWFFIRYAEGGEHIRLRLRLPDPEDSHALITGLTGLLQQELASGIVQDIAVKTYRRETERYGKENIERVEAHFCADSAYALELAAMEGTTHEKYFLCRELVRRVAASGFLPAVDFAALVVKLSASFNKEHRWGTDAFKELNKQYLRQRMAPSGIPGAIEPLFEAVVLSFTSTLTLCPCKKEGRSLPIFFICM
ncbi:thiopeptide-type bacteriocin biosynthesis protein [Mucilaginibacter sp. UC70_90]